ncbi:MAG: hypothetical protein LRZ88_09490, partial [Candidatus Cloacimonetes bacterium]|nr:hypothetical protein [Candidatus Cloacimonadota bacterium]
AVPLCWQSQDAGNTWASSINVPHTFNGQIYVRMNADAVGEFTNIEITHTNVNASPVVITVSGVANPPAGELENLFFSEYIEGASNNKAIEIF